MKSIVELKGGKMPTIDPLHTLLFLCAVHFIGDYAFQSAWMATKKCPRNYDPENDDAGPWEVLLYHCLTYTATFLIALELRGAAYSLWALLVIFTAHFIFDALRARKILIKSIWLDQLIHLLTLVPLVWIGWL